MENNQSNFWQFSDNLRIQTSNLAHLSLNDSIWSTNYAAKRTPEERRNFNFRNTAFGSPDLNSDFNLGGFSNDSWKSPVNDNTAAYGGGGVSSGYGSANAGLNGGFNKGVYTTSSLVNFNSYSKGKGFANNIVANGKFSKGKKNEEEHGGGKAGKKNRGNKESNKDVNGENKTAVDKRFKTLPPAEALPRNETIGGYIFVCNNDTMAENLKRQLFGLPPRYRDSVRAITPGLPLFLYNYSTHQLHGVFEIKGGP